MLNILDIPDTLKAAIEAHAYLVDVPVYVYNHTNADEIETSRQDVGAVVTVFPCDGWDKQAQMPEDLVANTRWLVALEVMPANANCPVDALRAAVAIEESVKNIPADEGNTYGGFSADGVDLVPVAGSYFYLFSYSRKAVIKLVTE